MEKKTARKAPRKPTKQQQINALIGAVRLLKSARYESLERKHDEEPLAIPFEWTETEQVFRNNGRVRSYVQAQDLYDNSTAGSTVQTFVRLCIGRRGGTPQFLGERQEGYQAYWTAYKRDCGWQSGEGWGDVLSQILTATLVEGDCLILCDPAITGGKIRIFAADQICSLGDDEFRTLCAENGWYEDLPSGREYWRQIEGVVTDLEGRVQGYIVTSLRNRPRTDRAHSTFIPASLARLIFNHTKLTQYRGESVLLPNRTLTRNTGSLIQSEVQAARNAAETALIIEEAEGMGSEDVAALLNATDAAKLTEGTNIDPSSIVAAANVENHTFDALAGRSAIATVPHGTTPHLLDNNNRPSHSIQDWLKELDEQNGQRLGVKSIISRANTAGVSYSSGELELSISWQAIESAQMLLERQVIDYVINAILPDAEYTIYWPEAFSIDPEKSEKVKDAKLRGGRATYREILGPYWRKQFEQLAEELKVAEELGILPYLSSTQTASGAQIETNEEENSDGNNTD